MNSEKRFGQIEEVLAELLMKVDRIADNQGQMLDLSVNNDAEIKQLKLIADSTARAVANLTVATDSTARAVANLTVAADSTARAVANLTVVADSTARAVANLTVDTQKNTSELNDRLSGIEQSQEVIVKILREKLG